METYTNAKNGKFGYVRLDKRYKDIALLKIEVVDVKDMARRKMMKGPFSPRLLEAIQESLDNNKQVILFQNRRGFVPIVECQDCGWIPKCELCDVSLTMHKNTNLLTCTIADIHMPYQKCAQNVAAYTFVAAVSVLRR